MDNIVVDAAFYLEVVVKDDYEYTRRYYCSKLQNNADYTDYD